MAVTEAILHVYDVLVPNNAQYNSAIKQFNNLLVSCNIGGILHGAIELYGYEYSFGYCPEGTGVYRCKPTKNPMYRYRSAHSLGLTSVSQDDLRGIIRTLMHTWQGTSYDLITRNCCHFCEELATVIRTEHAVPPWLNRMAGGVHSAISTYKAASLSMHQLSEQLHNGWKWMASGGAVPPQLHACYSTPTLPSQEGRLTATVVPPRRGQDMVLEGTLGCDVVNQEEEGNVQGNVQGDVQGDVHIVDAGHVGDGEGASCFSPGQGKLAATRSAPVLRDEALRSIARP